MSAYPVNMSAKLPVIRQSPKAPVTAVAQKASVIRQSPKASVAEYRSKSVDSPTRSVVKIDGSGVALAKTDIKPPLIQRPYLFYKNLTPKQKVCTVVGLIVTLIGIIIGGYTINNKINK